MNREKIVDMIDRNIVSLLINGNSILFIQQELKNKMNKYAISIKEGDKKVDLLNLLSVDVNTIEPIRKRYQVIYIKECEKRIKDLEWLLKNKYKFPKLSNSQVFNLIKLKEKLSEENALPF